MKNSLIYSFFVYLFLTNCLCSQSHRIFDMSVYRNLYRPYINGMSVEWMTYNRNDTNYSIKVIGYDGVPFRGEVFSDTNLLPIAMVNYWDSCYLVQNNLDFETTKRRVYLKWCDFNDTMISISDDQQISLYIVDAFSGDTILVKHFPQPTLDTHMVRTDLLSPWDKERLLTIHNIDASPDRIPSIGSSDVLSVNFILPKGVFWAYFINTSDRELRWVEKVERK